MDSGMIYVVTNTANGKQYVGLTRIGISKRWAQHCTKSRCPKTYFHRAIAKYGADVFIVNAYASALDKQQLSLLERDVIMQLAPAYNQTNGGEITFGRKYDDATIERIRQKNLGRARTEAQKIRMAEIKRAQYKDNPALRDRAAASLSAARGQWEEKRIAAVVKAAIGRVWTEEARRKLSAACTGRVYGPEIIARMAESKKRKILCDTTGVVYSCRIDAATACGISPRSVQRVCQGDYPSVKGLKFSYMR